MNAMRPPAAFSGGGRANEDVADIPGSDRIEQPARRYGLCACNDAFGERHRVAAAGKTNVEHGQVGELDAKAAERHGKPGRLALRQHQGSAGLRDARVEAARSDAIKQRYRGHVQRLLKRTARRHRALETQVEIFRRVGAIAHRAILDQRFRMRDAVFEGQTVNERLERGARRAQRVGHVDLACAALIEEIGRRHPRQHLAGRIVYREDRHRQIGAKRTGPFAGKFFELFLQAKVDSQPLHLQFRKAATA